MHALRIHGVGGLLAFTAFNGFHGKLHPWTETCGFIETSLSDAGMEIANQDI